MDNDKCKKEKKQKESHKTAAWADVSKKKKDTGVTVPSEENVEIAKDWVEENKK